jgi:selenocysteine lyase/cysteine desulfurase
MENPISHEAGLMINALADRSNYPGLNGSVYLNQASLGLIGQPAVQSMHDFLDHTARHGNLRMTDEEEVGFHESLRQRGARLLNCQTDQLAITASASELLGQLPFLIRAAPGSSIVAVATDFPAVTRPWIRYAVERECSLRFVDDIATENLTDTIIDGIDDRTAVVAVSSVQFATGSLVDVSRLSEACARAGARLVLDATQAAGIVRVDAERWNADAVVTSGYKWLGGHGGVALSAVSPRLLERDPPLPGWFGASSPFDFQATSLQYAADARRFTQSTMSYISMVGLTTALDHLTSLDGSRIEAHSRQLSLRLIQGANAYGWTPFRALDDVSASPHIVSLSHSELSAEKAIDALRGNGIVCGVRSGRIRISLAPYNDSADVDALIDALASI